MASSPVPLPLGWAAIAAADSDALVRAREAYPAAQRAGYTLDEIPDAIHQAFDALTSGEPLTQRHYRALSVELGLPSPSVIQRMSTRRNTSFGVLVREVAAERAARSRRA